VSADPFLCAMWFGLSMLTSPPPVSPHWLCPALLSTQVMSEVRAANTIAEWSDNDDAKPDEGPPEEGLVCADRDPDGTCTRIRQGPDIAWRCGETEVAWTEEDSGYSSGSSGINDSDTVIDIRNPPPRRFVLRFHTTAHAYSTWAAEMDGKPCDRIVQ
jgi:hypothetical protein